ncbi:LacI family DNA-binding transcriptional regulator [Aliiroseovarius sp. 2305UL8-7]|uniref:LacI family DNA-binding transcriptional regulator n=1 Tax=Aliiroseovarius conchicola TaxID=3121637 RepID=UPI0035273881
MSSQRNAPTLDDVARLAGVSTATVSRCINTPDRVIESTRNKVTTAINRLGYSPNFGARVMAAKRTNTIGAIIPTMENAIFARGLQAFQEGLRAKGYTLLVASSSYQADIEEEQIRSLVSRGADGLLLIGHDRDATIRKFLSRQNIPALVAWTHDPDADLPSIGFDNRKAMRALTRQVLDMGHRRIALISAATKGNDRARLRVQGAKDALREAGLNPDDLRIIETSYAIETGATAFADLMADATPPTAVMCGNDVMAAGAIRQARDMGLSVPGDISITGFDDIELARIVEPPLTTIHVPHRDMGSGAAEILVDMVENKSAGTTVELDATVCIRGSLAAPAD